MNRILMKWSLWCIGLFLMVGCTKEQSGFVTIYPDSGQAKVVRLQVVNDQIIRVQATSEDALPHKQSLMVVPQTARVDYDVQEDDAQVTVKTKQVKAVVSKSTGEVTFYDADGKVLLKEVILRPPYDGAKDYFYISNVDDRVYLVSLIKATLPALPKPRAKKNPMK